MCYKKDDLIGQKNMLQPFWFLESLLLLNNFLSKMDFGAHMVDDFLFFNRNLNMSNRYHKRNRVCLNFSSVFLLQTNSVFKFISYKLFFLCFHCKFVIVLIFHLTSKLWISWWYSFFICSTTNWSKTNLIHYQRKSYIEPWMGLGGVLI